MPDSKGRASRLRALAFFVLILGFALAFVVGTAYPASVASSPTTLSKVTNFTLTSESGAGAFNWLLAILVATPAVVAASVLYAGAEIVAALRRSGRTRSTEGSGKEGAGKETTGTEGAGKEAAA